MTHTIAAIALGNLHLTSKKFEIGSNNIAIKKEKISGESICLPIIAK